MKKYTKEQSIESMNLVKKYIMKLIKEFKAFINKGSVVDLAVGLMIGSAFTAIVSALVNNILKPLINWIPGINGTGALQTVLRNAVTDAEGNIVTEALIIDWGAVISAIITFFLTAVVTFALVKLFAKLKEAGLKLKDTAKDVAEKAIDGIKKEANTNKQAAKTEVSEAETEENHSVIVKDNANTISPSEDQIKAPAKIADAESHEETIEELLKKIIALLEKEKQ